MTGPRETDAGLSSDVAAVPARMLAVGRDIAAGRTDAAVDQQRRLLAELDELLKTGPSPSKATSPPTPEEQQELAGANQETSEVDGREQGAPGGGAARESSAQAQAESPRSIGVVERRRGLATAVWGHLPDRERERMLQAYQDEFLPEYAELVESYYEALAAERLTQPLEQSSTKP